MPALTKDEIKESVTMVDLLDRYGIKHDGRKALCPFHSEKTPSFTINGIVYYCFGCGAGGDIFNFVQQMENCGFKDALRRLGGGDGVRLTKPKPTSAQRKKKRKEQITGEWIKCLDFIRNYEFPPTNIDLSIVRDDDFAQLMNFSDRYVMQLHLLSYLEYLVFEEDDA